MNILLTGHTRWIWKYLFDRLKHQYNIVGLSRQNGFDLTKKSTFDKILSFVWAKKFDGIILNAWVGYFWKFESIELEKYEEIINLNLLANIRILKVLQFNIYPKTKIIFIGSIIGKKFLKYGAVYQASKFGLRWLAWWLKAEWKKVFIVNPKIVDTDFHWDLQINPNWAKTSLDDIWNTIENILLWKEKRFEIDL